MALFWSLIVVLGAQCAELPGRALFDAAGCRSCHSIGGVGGNAGPDLTLVGFRRSQEWLKLWLSDPKAWKPDTKMPNFRLSEFELNAVVDYLSQRRGDDFHGTWPWGVTGLDTVAKGKIIYARAGCVACHGAQGRGGHPNNNVVGSEIPAVYKAAEGYTLEELKTRIRSGRFPEKKDPSGRQPLVWMPAWGQILKDGDIEAVAAYLMSLAPPKKAEDF